MSSTDSMKIRKLLEQTSHYDRDERFMALSDLKRELETIQGLIESELQVPIRDAVLKQLDDGSNEVQGIAVSCLSALVLKFEKSHVIQIVQKLGQTLVDGKPEMRDSCADGLKSIFRAVPDEFGKDIANTVLEFLLRTITEVDKDDIDKTNFGLDVIETLLARFGSKFPNAHPKILKALFKLLHNDNKNLRNRIPTTLGILVHQLPDDQFADLMNHVISNIENAQIPNKRRRGGQEDSLYVYIQCIGVIGRHAGARIGTYLPKIVPLLMKYCEEEKEGSSPEEVMEIREKCLQAFESLILQCPNDITNFVAEIIQLSLKFITFDPNWQGGEGKDDMEDEDEDMGGWGDDDMGDDDDGMFITGDVDAEVVQDLDNAWRIRRASVATLAAFVTAKSGVLRDRYDQIAEGFITRFTDRDPDVTLELFRATRNLVGAAVVSKPEEAGPGAVLELSRQNSLGVPVFQRTESLAGNLDRHVDAMMKGLIEQVKHNGRESRENEISMGALNVVREICIVRDGGLEPWFDILFPCIVGCLAVDNTPLLSRSLDLISLLLHYHEPDSVRQYIPDLTDGIEKGVRNNESSVKTQGLDVCGRVVKAFRPDHSAYDPSYRPIVERLFTVSFEQMALVDIEQQVKISSIKAVSSILSRFGDILATQLDKTLRLLLERMKNQVTMVAALMSVTEIATSPVKINVKAIRTQCLSQATDLLRQHSPETRREAANCMIAMLKSPFSDGLDKRSLPKLLGELSPHISDEDMHLTHLIFNVVSAVVEIAPKVKIPKGINDQILEVLKSPLLQGNEALISLTSLYRTLLTEANSVTYSQILDQLLGIACRTKDLPSQAFSAIAQVVAGIASSSSEREQQGSITKFIDRVDHKEDAESQISLLCLGEIGQVKDLSATQAHSQILNAFGRKTEVVRQAASTALGRLSTGNLEFYMPILLGYIKEHKDRRYLLLNSLKETIQTMSKNKRQNELKSHIDSILPILVKNAGSNDEGVRTMIAECLGHLEAVDCDSVFSEVEKHLTSSSQVEVRQTMVASVRFCLEGDKNVMDRIKENLKRYIDLMKKSEPREVRRQAFLTIDAILKHDPTMLQYHLVDGGSARDDQALLDIIYKATIYDPSLVKTSDLGLVKVKVDWGLPLRKAAFLIMGTLAERATYYLEMREFIVHFKTGVIDNNPDIQMTTYNHLTHLAKNHGPEILSEVESLADPFTKGIKKKLKDAKLRGQEQIDAINVLRASVKTLRAIYKIEGARSLTKFVRFYKAVLKTPRLKTMLEEIEQEDAGVQ